MIGESNMDCQLNHAKQMTRTGETTVRNGGEKVQMGETTRKLILKCVYMGAICDLWMDCTTTHRLYYTLVYSFTFFAILLSYAPSNSQVVCSPLCHATFNSFEVTMDPNNRDSDQTRIYNSP